MKRTVCEILLIGIVATISFVLIGFAVACNPCKPGAQRCNGSIVEICRPDKRWSKVQDCSKLKRTTKPFTCCCRVENTKTKCACCKAAVMK